MVVKILLIILSVIALVFLTIVAVIVLLLFIPVKIEINYEKNGEITAILKYLFLKFNLSEDNVNEENLENDNFLTRIMKKKEKSEEVEKATSSEKKDKNNVDETKKILPEKTNDTSKKEDTTAEKETDKKSMDYDVVIAGYGALSHVIERLSKKAIKLLKKIKLKKIYFYLMLEGDFDNPYSTAKTYGNVNIAVYSFYSLLTNVFKIHDKSTNIIINPNFSEMDFDCKVSFNIIFIPMSIVVSGLSIGIEVLKAYFKFKNILKEDKNINK